MEREGVTWDFAQVDGRGGGCRGRGLCGGFEGLEIVVPLCRWFLCGFVSIWEEGGRMARERGERRKVRWEVSA